MKALTGTLTPERSSAGSRSKPALGSSAQSRRRSAGRRCRLSPGEPRRSSRPAGAGSRARPGSRGRPCPPGSRIARSGAPWCSGSTTGRERPAPAAGWPYRESGELLCRHGGQQLRQQQQQRHPHPERRRRGVEHRDSPWDVAPTPMPALAPFQSLRLGGPSSGPRSSFFPPQSFKFGDAYKAERRHFLPLSLRPSLAPRESEPARRCPAASPLPEPSHCRGNLPDAAASPGALRLPPPGAGCCRAPGSPALPCSPEPSVRGKREEASGTGREDARRPGARGKARPRLRSLAVCDLAAPLCPFSSYPSPSPARPPLSPPRPTDPRRLTLPGAPGGRRLLPPQGLFLPRPLFHAEPTRRTPAAPGRRAAAPDPRPAEPRPPAGTPRLRG